MLAVLQGEAVQVDPINPTLKAPGTKRFKLKSDELLSNFAFKLELRRYSKIFAAADLGDMAPGASSSFPW